jgi:hypothetical protein
LTPEKWRQILEEEGFESIFFPAEEARKLGQQIIVAASNGWVRQPMEFPDQGLEATANPQDEAMLQLIGEPSPTFQMNPSLVGGEVP